MRWRSLPLRASAATLWWALACSTPDANVVGAGGTSASAGQSGAAGNAGASSAGTFNGGGATTNGGATTMAGAAANGGTSGQAGQSDSGGVNAAGSSSGGSTSGSAGAATGGTAGAGTAGSGTAGAGGAAYDPCPTDGSPCNIMPFGDSITDGYNPDTPGGYRVELFRLAHSSGKNITFVGSGQNGPDMVDGVPFPHQHEGHSGWTIAPAGGRSGISTLVASVMPQFKPHIVLLMIGTNDAIDDYQMAQAPQRLGSLIDSVYAQLPSVLLVVAQPIPGRGDAAKGDDASLSARIKTFDDALPAVVKQRADAGKHILLVDMYTPFAPNKASLLEDQWHPNAAGYVLLAQQWWNAVGPLL